MPGPVFREGDRVTLRTVEREDVPLLQRARTEPATRRPLALHTPESEPAVEDFFEDVVVGDDASVNLLACVDGDPVGGVALFEIDERRGRGTIAYWLLPEAQGEGYATDAVGALLDYAFEERRLHRVRADVAAPNDASRRLLERLGFTEEGRLREATIHDGERVDDIRYGILGREWRGDGP